MCHKQAMAGVCSRLRSPPSSLQLIGAELLESFATLSCEVQVAGGAGQARLHPSSAAPALAQSVHSTPCAGFQAATRRHVDLFTGKGAKVGLGVDRSEHDPDSTQAAAGGRLIRTNTLRKAVCSRLRWDGLGFGLVWLLLWLDRLDGDSLAGTRDAVGVAHAFEAGLRAAAAFEARLMRHRRRRCRQSWAPCFRRARLGQHFWRRGSACKRESAVASGLTDLRRLIGAH